MPTDYEMRQIVECGIGVKLQLIRKSSCLQSPPAVHLSDEYQIHRTGVFLYLPLQLSLAVEYWLTIVLRGWHLAKWPIVL